MSEQRRDQHNGTKPTRFTTRTRINRTAHRDDRARRALSNSNGDDVSNSIVDPNCRNPDVRTDATANDVAKQTENDDQTEPLPRGVALVFRQRRRRSPT